MEGGDAVILIIDNTPSIGENNGNFVARLTQCQPLFIG